MKCADFQKMTPDIINNTVPDEKLDEVIEHIDNCKDCREELEIHYILRYGLGDDEDEEATDFIGQLENNISRMKAKRYKFTIQRSVYALIMLTAYTAIIGSWIYVLFKYFV